MDHENSETLPSELELALAYTPAELRDKFRALLAFDQRLARIVAATTEPMLGQMRLAWWREQLVLDHSERPEGDAVLDALGRHWAGYEDALTLAINAHELMVATETLSSATVEDYVGKRSAAFAHLVPCGSDPEMGAIVDAARLYVCADTASRLSDAAERELFVRHGNTIPATASRLPWSLRGLGVLRALALRSLKSGGRPLMEGRGAALVALRAAMIGR